MQHAAYSANPAEGWLSSVNEGLASHLDLIILDIG